MHRTTTETQTERAATTAAPAPTAITATTQDVSVTWVITSGQIYTQARLAVVAVVVEVVAATTAITSSEEL